MIVTPSIAPTISVVPSGSHSSVVPVAPATPEAGLEAKDKSGKATKATVVVSLPAEAKLFFDGKQTKTTSERREFVSPELEPGQDYHYTIKAEVVRDGKTDVKTETVTVRAGKVSRISFDFPTAVASK